MKPVFDIKNFNYCHTCMLCDTPTKAEIFAEYLDSLGLTYSSGCSYSDKGVLKRAISRFDTRLCFYFNYGFIGQPHALRNARLLSFDDFDWKWFIKHETMEEFISSFKII